MPKALVVRLAIARRPAAGGFKLLRQMAVVRSNLALPAKTPDTLSIHCCPYNSESMR